MQQRFFIIFMLISTVTVLTFIGTCTAVSSRKNASLRRQQKLPNICETDGPSKIVCHCSFHTTGNKKADCWIDVSNLTDDDSAWDGFQTNSDLKQLVMTVSTRGILDFLPQHGLRHLKNLNRLSISYGKIPIIRANALSNLSSSLTEVDLINNEIYTLERYAFAHMPALESLNLSFNEIKFLDRNLFYNDRNLKVLHLSTNNITHILDNAFATLVKLEELRLDYNFLTKITARMLDGLDNLIKLVLTGNYFTEIDNFIFSRLRNLEILDLDDNAIRTLSLNAFDGLISLKQLNLEGNELKLLDARNFNNLPKMTVLNLSRNQLTKFSINRSSPLFMRLLDEDSMLFLDGNDFVCNTNLLWLFELRTLVLNENFQHNLNNLQCENERNEMEFLLRLNPKNLPQGDDSIADHDTAQHASTEYHNESILVTVDQFTEKNKKNSASKSYCGQLLIITHIFILLKLTSLEFLKKN